MIVKARAQPTNLSRSLVHEKKVKTSSFKCDRGQPPSGQPPQQRGRPLMVVKLDTNSFTSRVIAAAHQKNQFVKKYVLYIGNVNNLVSVDVMYEFITTDLSVEILSLFETKPRQRRRLTSTSSCSSDGAPKAFRLCINKDHCDRLLVGSKWPPYVSVSEWFFKTSVDNMFDRLALSNIHHLSHCRRRHKSTWQCWQGCC